ncbi:hypothetical protein [uncultured Roseibium sp.]|uniref:hypothetical protein n=1 Tax=uncultured Roseibium sp. TaxID=1936171 RepID=UPI0032165A66
MLRYTPISLFFFVAAGAVYLLQLFPGTGIFLMFAGAMLWSVALINLGMIGTALEAIVRAKMLWWLSLPIVFYGVYWTNFAVEHQQLAGLTRSFDTANASVATGFNPESQELVFNNEKDAAWIVRNYDIARVYIVDAKTVTGYRSFRLVDKSVCTRVSDNGGALRDADITIQFLPADLPSRRFAKIDHLCLLSMPETPLKEPVRVSKTRNQKKEEGLLPTVQHQISIEFPDGRLFEILGGTAAPLTFFPQPILGCGLNSSKPAWECIQAFRREPPTPILSGTSKQYRDLEATAKALDLAAAEPELRDGADSSALLTQISEIEETALSHQLGRLQEMMSDPVSAKPLRSFELMLSRPEVLKLKAPAIMDALERVAEITGKGQGHAPRNGRQLARLMAQLPLLEFFRYGDRILALFSAADDKHWLWKVDPLVRKLGYLGTAALPVLSDEKLWHRHSSVANEAFEAACIIGAPGRAILEPLLLMAWDEEGPSTGSRPEIFIALRRLGATPLPFENDKFDLYNKLVAEWVDISPDSPLGVCDVSKGHGIRKRIARDALRRKP